MDTVARNLRGPLLPSSYEKGSFSSDKTPSSKIRIGLETFHPFGKSKKRYQTALISKDLVGPTFQKLFFVKPSQLLHTVYRYGQNVKTWLHFSPKELP